MTGRVGTRRRAWSLAPILALGLLAAPAAGRQAAGGADTLALTLAEAIRIAEANNPAYRRSLNQLALNAAETRDTWLNTVLPSTTLTLFSTAYNGNIRRRAIDEYGNPVINPRPEWAYFSNTRQSLTLDWNVQGTNLLGALGRQRETNRGRELVEEGTRTAATSSVGRQFFRAQEESELLRTELELEEQRRVDLELTERLFSLAERSRVDVLNAELALQQQALAIRRQRARRAEALLGLRTLLGDPDLPPLGLTEEAVHVFDPGALDLEPLVLRALATNPSVLQAASAERLAGLGVREQRNRRWPSVNLFYRVARVAQTPESNALFDLSWDEDLDHNFGVSLSLPFFDNWLRSSVDVRRAEVERANRGESLREARLQVEQAVRSAVLALENQRETLRLAERSLEIAREALGLAREEYRLGARTFEQLRESVEQEALSRRQVIEARYRFMDALVTLEEAVGGPVRPPPAADAAGPVGADGAGRG